MSLRVAMLGQYPLDTERILGGVEAVMVPLLQALAAYDDLDVHVVACLPGVRDHLARTSSGQPLRVVRRHRGGRLTFHRRDIAVLDRELERISPSIVHAQGMGIYADAAASYGAPHVVTAHGIFFREARFARGWAGALRGLVDGAYERYCARRVKNLISISPYVAEELSRFAAFSHVYPIENPVDDRYFAEGSTAQEATTLLYAGRVIARKGLLDLLGALIGLRSSFPNVRLRVAGETETDPDYVEACRSFLARHDLAGVVEFLGPLSTNDMVEEYGRCALVVLPSHQETAPVVVAEAMAAGRAVVATKVCGLPYMVEPGISGELVECGNVAGLQVAISSLLSDSWQRVAIERAAREQAERRFRAAVVAERTRQVYRELASEGQ